ncbi:galactosyl transferase GMA12/MNN10 family-domain-containing protein [Phyllosticta citribraziliensis]
MSLSRSPSPQPGGGWSSPGLTTPMSPYGSGSGSGSGSGARSVSPRVSTYATSNGAHNVTWSSAKARSAEVRAFSPRSSNFFQRHLRRISDGLPLFANGGLHKAEKEKAAQPWAPQNRTGGYGDLPTWIWRRLRMLKLRFLLIVLVLIVYFLLHIPPIERMYNRSLWFGGGKKFVVLVAANVGGGVMEWKGPREWAIERDSVKNKKKYARKWGYELEIVDMSTKKRYAHEWRESWEKVDTIRNAMHKYPDAEWFWWLDLNTFIMEPSYSLQKHVFSAAALEAQTYRDINVYNPLNILHPLTEPYLDPLSRSATGDNKTSSINLIVPQDCSGFNLGSFFVRRSTWTDRLLDIWWDPVGYEQKHMQWEHKEQDALEYLYANQPWVRSNVAFIQQRRVNAFPPGACAAPPQPKPKEGGKEGEEELEEGIDPLVHYSEHDRDFLVNMAGCEWGRDCWGEMYHYRELSRRLNRTWWERTKESLGRWWRGGDGVRDPAEWLLAEKNGEAK